jgi:hypothetical protein
MKAVILSIFWVFLIEVNGRGLSVDNSLNNGFISLYKDTEVIMQTILSNVKLIPRWWNYWTATSASSTTQTPCGSSSSTAIGADIVRGLLLSGKILQRAAQVSFSIQKQQE